VEELLVDPLLVLEELNVIDQEHVVGAVALPVLADVGMTRGSTRARRRTQTGRLAGVRDAIYATGLITGQQADHFARDRGDNR
jgi:hypothetical protein